MKKILIVTELYFPHGAAMSERIFSFCKLFKEAGFDSHIIAMHSNKEIVSNKIYQYNNFTYQIIKNEERTSLDSFLGSNEFIKQIELYLKNNKVDYVFCASVHSKFNKVLKTCRKNNVPLILEQCEWYDVSSYKFGYLDYRYIKFNYNIRFNYYKADYIICISRLLEDFYRKKGCRTIRIPSIFDVESKEFSLETKNNNIKLVYTGYPSKSKDILSIIINALLSDREYLKNIELDIYGPTKENLINEKNIKYDSLEKKCDSIKIYGKVSNDEIEKAYLKSDYQIFVRPIRKSSNAGFSTKFAESLTHAVPTITNITSDLGLYLKDGENGFVCNDISIKSVASVFDKILKLDQEQKQEMRRQARKTAEENFDYKAYVDVFKNMLDK